MINRVHKYIYWSEIRKSNTHKEQTRNFDKKFDYNLKPGWCVKNFHNLSNTYSFTFASKLAQLQPFPKKIILSQPKWWVVEKEMETNMVRMMQGSIYRLTWSDHYKTWSIMDYE